MADSEDSGFFSLCVFAFVRNKNLTESLEQQLSETIINHGGEVTQPKRDGTIPLDQVTHIISNTIDFPQYTEAAAMMLPVVKSNWVTMSLAKRKQAQVRHFTPDPRMIFSDVAVSCAGLPSSDKNAIVGAVMAMGGMDSDNLSKATTHICALAMDNPKCKLVEEKKLKCKIVLPHWFDDCFKLGKRIDETPYLLPDPEVLQSHHEEAVKVPSSQHLEGATSAQPDYLPPTDSVPGARPTLTVFAEKKIMLSADLAIRGRLQDILKQLITSGGGEMTDDVQECDWDGIPGFKDTRITVSNYGGEARIYLENLIIAAGASFTKTMKSDNTHLITARDNSEKCEAARDWNINMVNHLWVEESYAKCEMQSITVPKYTHFPPRTNLGEVIGQTFLDESKLAAIYYPGGPEKPTTSSKRKRKVLELTDDNSFSEGPADGVVIGRQARKEFDVMKDSEADYEEKTTEVFGVPAPKRRAAQVSTPARGRHVRSGKENETPSTVSVTPSSRSAKDKALHRISDLAPDIALYEKEKKRRGSNGHWGGKRAADHIEKEHLNRRSHSSPTNAVEEEAEEPKSEKRPAKRAKPSLKEVEMRVVLTGFKRWVNDKHKEDADRKKLRELGIQVVADGNPCDYLVAPQLVRTVKFLRNLSKGATVVSSDWIEECLDTKKVLDPKSYLLKDRDNERKFGLNLQSSVEKARKNKGKLLWSIPIYCTACIKNGTESYKAIAEANGAIFMVYAARSGTTIKPTRPEEDDGGPEPVYLLSTTNPEEKKLWKKFEDMARKGNMEPRVVASDWLLDVVMKQEVSFDKKYLVSNFFN
ncbi:putative brca1 c terminus domain-containing protein [Eutypa lata UCREL1]|uniref:Putative brca1 c terminus domain-containing protein n=1 Tax=Eutypa lata (strain UCR-EL1) TaxID=1287681 RepID=M7T0V6_EUTLA|nr:putative brca1 c terminus domain-containing protein [Eutypa lata UCREL1]